VISFGFSPIDNGGTMEKNRPKWVGTIYFIVSGLFFLTAILWFLNTFIEGQQLTTILAIVFLCLGFTFLALGLAFRKKQKQ